MIKIPAFALHWLSFLPVYRAKYCRSSARLPSVPHPPPSLQDVLETSTIEELLMGMASQIAEREDAVLCSDVRDKLFGPMEFSRRDLGALNIMRGRDNGLPDYNTVRKCFQVSFAEEMPLSCTAGVDLVSGAGCGHRWRS